MLTAGGALLGAPASYVPVSGTWTHEWLVERLADAGDTLRRLPKPKGQERSLHAAWPEMLREWLAYGDETTQVRRARPHPQAITRLDEVLEMLMWLTPAQRAVLWARHAERMTWPKIQFLDAQTHRGKGRGQRQPGNTLNDGEARILNRLNGTPHRMVLTRGMHLSRMPWHRTAWGDAVAV